ncbi:hypothetical protein [Staphylococcus gallinarum]|uniref:hypothetical protein n=1 Tax=Staphylococcus gallinarum TaxID=1293 RepID=UPI0031732EE9
MISNMYEIIQERDKLEVENKELKHENEALRLQSDTYFEQWQQHKAERDTLIDDIAVLRANNKRLERENNDLRLQADTYFDEWQNVKNLYNALTQHIRDKAEANPNVDRYIALVNYIDRLEKGES